VGVVHVVVPDGAARTPGAEPRLVGGAPHSAGRHQRLEHGRVAVAALLIGRLDLRILLVGFRVLCLLCFSKFVAMLLHLLRSNLVGHRGSGRGRGGTRRSGGGAGASAPADAALAEEQVGEVEARVLAAELEGLAVVGHGGVLGGVEGAEPEARAFPGEADLRHPLAPVALPHAAVQLRWALPLRAEQLLEQRRRDRPAAEPARAQVQRLVPVPQQHLLVHLRRHELRREQRTRRAELLLMLLVVAAAAERNHLLALHGLLRRKMLLVRAGVLGQGQDPRARRNLGGRRGSRIVRERKFLSRQWPRRRRRRQGVGNRGRVRGSRGGRERGHGAAEKVGAARLLQGPEEFGRGRVF
jgi:hypothetical protein